MSLIIALVVIVAGLAFAAAYSPTVKAALAKVFGTKTVDAAADVATKVEDSVKKQ